MASPKTQIKNAFEEISNAEGRKFNRLLEGYIETHGNIRINGKPVSLRQAVKDYPALEEAMQILSTTPLTTNRFVSTTDNTNYIIPAPDASKPPLTIELREWQDIKKSFSNFGIPEKTSEKLSFKQALLLSSVLMSVAEPFHHMDHKQRTAAIRSAISNKNILSPTFLNKLEQSTVEMRNVMDGVVNDGNLTDFVRVPGRGARSESHHIPSKAKPPLLSPESPHQQNTSDGYLDEMLRVLSPESPRQQNTSDGYLDEMLRDIEQHADKQSHSPIDESKLDIKRTHSDIKGKAPVTKPQVAPISPQKPKREMESKAPQMAVAAARPSHVKVDKPQTSHKNSKPYIIQPKVRADGSQTPGYKQKPISAAKEIEPKSPQMAVAAAKLPNKPKAEQPTNKSGTLTVSELKKFHEQAVKISQESKVSDTKIAINPADKQSTPKQKTSTAGTGTKPTLLPENNLPKTKVAVRDPRDYGAKVKANAAQEQKVGSRQNRDLAQTTQLVKDARQRADLTTSQPEPSIHRPGKRN